MMAKGLIDVAGPDVLRRLWDAFALSDEQLAGVLGGRVHPDAGRWLASSGRGLYPFTGAVGPSQCLRVPHLTQQ
jgi:hypothetical protein